MYATYFLISEFQLTILSGDAVKSLLEHLMSDTACPWVPSRGRVEDVGLLSCFYEASGLDRAVPEHESR